MIALLTACLFFEILVQGLLKLHQQKRARKLCSATLILEQEHSSVNRFSLIELLIKLVFMLVDV